MSTVKSKLKQDQEDFMFEGSINEKNYLEVRIYPYTEFELN